MNSLEIREKVGVIVVEQLGVDANEVTDTAGFIDDLGCDSLDTVELVMAFEEEFNIEIPDRDGELIYNTKDAAEFIDKLLNEPNFNRKDFCKKRGKKYSWF